MTVSAPALLDIDALAGRLGVNARFVRRLVEERRIPFLKIGKFVRFDPVAIDTWIQSNRVEPARPFDVAEERRPLHHVRSR
jgi:excisionase family DNA binding protein